MVFNQRTLTDIDGQTLEFTGTYTLLLEGEVGQGAVAGYDFAVYPTRMQDALLPIGERIASTIAQPGESDRYSFPPTAPARLRFDALRNPAGINSQLPGRHSCWRRLGKERATSGENSSARRD